METPAPRLPLTIIVIEDNPVDVYLIRWVLHAYEPVIPGEPYSPGTNATSRLPWHPYRCENSPYTSRMDY